MRLLPVSLFCTLFASVTIGASTEQILGAEDLSGELPSLEDHFIDDDVPQDTIFNGVSVPPIPEIDGEKFNSTVKDGWWFVKHYS